VKKIFILLLGILVFGANLINVNFFEAKNKLDILFSLDDVFKGKVKKISKNSYLITDIKTDKVIQKEFNDNFINSIIISPQNDGVKVDISARKDFITNVALTPDGYGVRFRIKNKTPNTSKIKNNELKKMTANRSGLDTFSYIIGLVILFVLALFLWFIKRKTPALPKLKEDMKVLAQKPIDPKNKVVLFEYQKRKYLMLIGNTNVLLDVFVDDVAIPKSEEQFDEMLKLAKKYDVVEKYIKNAEKLKEIDEIV
jgi:flagellar biogenesis protein FliO